jgi:hypothetical protein
LPLPAPSCWPVLADIVTHHPQIIDNLDIDQMQDRTLRESDMLVRGRETTFYADRLPAPAPPVIAFPSPTRSRTGGLRSTSVSAPTSSSNGAGRLFAGKAFVSSFVSEADSVAALVTANGGRYVEDVYDFYRVEGATGTGGLQNGEYNSSHLKYVSDNRTILGLYLLADSATRRPKAFKALALGVPCISTHFIRDALDDQAAGEMDVSLSLARSAARARALTLPTTPSRKPLDWRAYKLATPPSCVAGIDPNTNKGNASSQSFIHPDWGTSHAITRDPLRATPANVERPFTGLKFLYIHRSRSDRVRLRLASAGVIERRPY